MQIKIIDKLEVGTFEFDHGNIEKAKKRVIKALKGRESTREEIQLGEMAIYKIDEEEIPEGTKPDEVINYRFKRTIITELIID